MSRAYDLVILVIEARRQLMPLIQSLLLGDDDSSTMSADHLPSMWIIHTFVSHFASAGCRNLPRFFVRACWKSAWKLAHVMIREMAPCHAPYRPRTVRARLKLACWYRNAYRGMAYRASRLCGYLHDMRAILSTIFMRNDYESKQLIIAADNNVSFSSIISGAMIYLMTSTIFIDMPHKLARCIAIARYLIIKEATEAHRDTCDIFTQNMFTRAAW